MALEHIQLRDMRPSDSASLKALTTEVKLTGMTSHFQIDPYTALVATDTRRSFGVVAEATNVEGIVGLATVSFGEMRFNGRMLPFAYFANLKVRPDFRKQGIGFQLAKWRLDRAEQEFGDQGVIMTGLERGNDASRATARKWSREFFEPLQLAVVPTRSYPPRPQSGITVSEVDPAKLDEFTAKQNHFYEQYNLYEPITPEVLATRLKTSPVTLPFDRAFVSSNRAGEMLAGIQVRARGVVIVDEFHNPPAPLKVMNPFLHLLPSNFRIHELGASDLWYEGDQLAAAQYLWQAIRWECRTSGTTLTYIHDPRGGLGAVFHLRSWNQPRPELAIAIRGPEAIDRQKLIYLSNRR